MNIPKHNRKRPYEVGHFTEDCVARDWINDKFDEGYVLDALTTKVVADSRDKRKQVVEITIIMRLNLPGGPPPSAASALPILPPCPPFPGFAAPPLHDEPRTPAVSRPACTLTLRDLSARHFADCLASEVCA